MIIPIVSALYVDCLLSRPTSLHFNEFISTDYKTVTIMFQMTDLNTRLYKGWLKSNVHTPPPLHGSLFTLAHIFIRLMAI